VHGNGGGGFRFERMRPFLPAEIEFHPVTLPGFGGSPRDPSLQTLRGYAQALAALCRQARPPRVVLGHGIGGSILLELLQAEPAIADLAIFHAPVGASLDRRFFPRLMRPLWVREAGKRAFASPLFRPLWRRLLFRGPVPEAYLDRFFGEYAQCAAFAQMFDLITAEWFSNLQPVRTPALLIWGAEERVLRSGQHREFLRLLPGAFPVIVPGWDHFPMIDCPEEYTREVVTRAGQLLRQGVHPSC
jgi:pimeloyl-ACP methyl ester carboxylesterase